MILWFTGQPGSGKTTLAKRFKDDKLINFMKVNPKDIIHIDGEELRNVTNNKNLTKPGRIWNIKLAINMARFLDNKGYIVIASLVSPYRDLREELKMERNIAEFYLHTTEIRGKESYFVSDYEPPLHNFTDLDTDKPIEECLDEILAVYRKMAAVA